MQFFHARQENKRHTDQNTVANQRKRRSKSDKSSSDKPKASRAKADSSPQQDAPAEDESREGEGESEAPASRERSTRGRGGGSRGGGRNGTNNNNQEKKMSNEERPQSDVTPQEVGDAAVSFMNDLVTAFGADGESELTVDGTELDVQVREGYAKYDFQGVFQAVFTFATLELSAFYFDIRKDALYCDGDTTRRRAARTVLDIVFHRLTKWLAPMLTFTMEEVWLERFAGAESSIHLEDFAETPTAWHDPALAAKWAEVRKVRRVVTGALEVERTAKVIGASLEAAPTVHVSAATAKLLETVSFDDLCITSGIFVSTDAAPEGAFCLDDVADVAVVFARAEGEKCQRCWKILPDVGRHAHDGVCSRCNEALG